MTDGQRRRYNMFVRVREFFAQHVADFAAQSVAVQLFNRLVEIINRIDAQASAQAGHRTAARQQSQSTGDARRTLRARLRLVHLAARGLNLESQFPMPPKGSDRDLISFARGVITNAQPIAEQFVGRELDAGFFDELGQHVSGLQTSIAGQNTALGDGVEATATLDDAVDEGVDVVEELNAIMRVKYADNPGVLAEWTSASHVERAPKRAKPAGGTPAGTPTPGGPQTPGAQTPHA